MHSSSINLQCSVSLLFIFMYFGVLGHPMPAPLSSSTTSTSTTSEHTCPPSTDKSKPLRYHVPTGQCYRTKTKGPCSNNQMFYSTGDGKTYGDCDCPLTNSEAPWIYHEKTDQCYKAFEQGHCSEGQWLIFDEFEIPTCVKNKCSAEIASAGPDAKIVLFSQQCVKLYDSSPVCKSDEIVSFHPDDVTPSCRKETAEYNIAKTAQLKCKPGMRRDIVGKCRMAISSQSSFMKIGR